MALTKTPICDFGKKADHFELKSTGNKIVSLNDIKVEEYDLLVLPGGVKSMELLRLDDKAIESIKKS